MKITLLLNAGVYSVETEDKEREIYNNLVYRKE